MYATSRPSSVAGGAARSRAIASEMSERSSTRTDSCPVTNSPCSTASSSSRSSRVRPLAFSSAASRATASAAEMPSLSRATEGETA